MTSGKRFFFLLPPSLPSPLLLPLVLSASVREEKGEGKKDQRRRRLRTCVDVI